MPLKIAKAAHLKVSSEVRVPVGFAQELRHLSAKQMVHDARARLEIVKPRQQCPHRLPAYDRPKHEVQSSFTCLRVSSIISTPSQSEYTAHTLRTVWPRKCCARNTLVISIDFRKCVAYGHISVVCNTLSPWPRAMIPKRYSQGIAAGNYIARAMVLARRKKSIESGWLAS